MNMNQFTHKSIEALRDMQSAALENGNQQIEQVHLLHALISKEDGLIPNLITKSGASLEDLRAKEQKLDPVIGRDDEIRNDLGDRLQGRNTRNQIKKSEAYFGKPLFYVIAVFLAFAYLEDARLGHSFCPLR